MPKSFSTVSVVGLGYIGLPTAAVMAQRQIKVIGVDINADIVNAINRGQVHIVEPELDGVVHQVVSEGLFVATTVPTPADAFLITVPTPFNEDYEADLSYIQSACKAIATVLKAGDLVVLESTSPVGTTLQVSVWLQELRKDLLFPHTDGEASDIRIAYCPERVMPGHILHELVKNDRIIGGMTPLCSKKAVELYTLFVDGECLITNDKTAEICKLTENSFRDVNIAFANELSMICDKLDINVWELIHLANRHPRVNILKPGPGVGGHCIAVDPWFIVSKTPKEAQLIRKAREVNDSKPRWVIEKIKSVIAEVLIEHPEKRIHDVTITFFGLAFKADIDDFRESPALKIAAEMVSIHPGCVSIVEPYLTTLPAMFEGKAMLKQAEEALLESDIAVILVDHRAFHHVFNDTQLPCKIVDTRGISCLGSFVRVEN